MKFVNYSNFEAPKTSKISKSALIEALLKYETKDPKKAAKMVEGLDEEVEFGVAANLFTDKLKALSVLRLNDATITISKEDMEKLHNGGEVEIDGHKIMFEAVLNEGQFSWMTQDTGEQIGSESENTITVYMYDNEGNRWEEKRYEGYGEFGGMDYYSLLDKMNGGEGDRDAGIKLAFDEKKVKAGKVLFPALVTDPRFNWKRHNFKVEAEHDPNQSWYQEEEYDEEWYDSAKPTISWDSLIEKINNTEVNEWGSSDQSIMNKAIHKDAGSPKKMPSPFDSKLRRAAEDAVDFYWDDWEEYETDRDGLIDNAVRGYLRQYFRKDWDLMVRMFEPMESVVTEAVAKNTKIYQIATPAPKAMLVEELEDLFGDDYRHIVTEFDDDERYESVLVFNLTPRDIKRIQEEIGDVLIWEYSIKKGKEIMESVVTEAKYDKKKLLKLIKNQDDAEILVNGKWYIIYNPDNGNDENTEMWAADDYIYALDPDGEEYQIKYKDIEQFKESVEVAEDMVPGGLADGMSAQDLADRHSVDVAEIEAAIEKGIKVEMEHTDDKKIAHEVAMDHIFEDPKYYDKLADMENESAEVNEADMNDPVLMAFRAAKMKREAELAKPKRRPLYGKQREKAEDDLWQISQDLKDLYADRGQMLIDMEQEAEVEGGPIADEYGDKLNKIEDEIQKLIAKRNKLEMMLAEGFVTEARYSVGDKWEWKHVDGPKTIEIMGIEPNGDVLAVVIGTSDQFILREPAKYLKKKINESETLDEARSIAKIQKEWSKVTDDMKSTVDAWKSAEGKEKEDLLKKLKDLTATKKKLEFELDTVVGLKDADAELVGESVNEGEVDLYAEIESEISNIYSKLNDLAEETTDTKWRKAIEGIIKGFEGVEAKIGQASSKLGIVPTNEGEDYSDEMSFGQLENCIDYSTKIRERIEAGTSLDPWMHSQIAVAKNELNSVWDALDGDDGVVENNVNEAKTLDRDAMIDWLDQTLSFTRTSEEFDGAQGGIWTTGENGEEWKGKVIYAYYSEDYKNRTFGVLNSWEKELNKRGWYSEWYDAGTVMIWPN